MKPGLGYHFSVKTVRVRVEMLAASEGFLTVLAAVLRAGDNGFGTAVILQGLFGLFVFGKEHS